MSTLPPPSDDGRSNRHVRLLHPRSGDTTLLLVRHGQTAGNLAKLLCGVTDLPLDEVGRRQARLIADRLASEVPVDAIVSSPLKRAWETAETIGVRIGLAPTVAPDLREMDFGIFEGATIDRVASERPDLAKRLLDVEDYDVTWPDGESRRGFYDRVWRAFHDILHHYASHRVVVVAHGGVIGAFLALVEDRSPNDLAAYYIHNCSLTHLRVTPDHTVVHLRNDICHLDLAVESAADGGD